MDGSPQRWWQWVLMYPTIVLALGGAIPQYYQWISAVAIGLSPFGDVGDGERNFSCGSGCNGQPSALDGGEVLAYRVDFTNRGATGDQQPVQILQVAKSDRGIERLFNQS